MWSEEPASHHHADRLVHGGCKENGSRNESDAEMVARGLDWAQALSCASLNQKAVPNPHLRPPAWARRRELCADATGPGAGYQGTRHATICRMTNLADIRHLP